MGRIRDTMLALRAATLSHLHGAPVLAYEPINYPAPIDIDDCSEVYLDNVVPMFPEIDTPCIASPSGQCTYDALAGDEHDCCIYCGRRTG